MEQTPGGSHIRFTVFGEFTFEGEDLTTGQVDKILDYLFDKDPERDAWVALQEEVRRKRQEKVKFMPELFAQMPSATVALYAEQAEGVGLPPQSDVPTEPESPQVPAPAQQPEPPAAPAEEARETRRVPIGEALPAGGFPIEGKAKEMLLRAAEEIIPQNERPPYFVTGIREIPDRDNPDGPPVTVYRTAQFCPHPNCTQHDTLIVRWAPIDRHYLRCLNCRTAIALQPATKKGRGTTQEHRDRRGYFLVAREFWKESEKGEKP